VGDLLEAVEAGERRTYALDASGRVYLNTLENADGRTTYYPDGGVASEERDGRSTWYRNTGEKLFEVATTHVRVYRGGNQIGTNFNTAGHMATQDTDGTIAHRTNLSTEYYANNSLQAHYGSQRFSLRGVELVYDSPRRLRMGGGGVLGFYGQLPRATATGPETSAVAVTGTTFVTALSKTLTTSETCDIQVTGMLTVNLTTLGVSPRNTAWTWRVTLDGVPQTGLNAQRQGGFQPQNSHGALNHTFEGIAAGSHTVALQIAAANAGDTINLPVGFATFTAVATLS
jgi:predicted secreted protein